MNTSKFLMLFSILLITCELSPITRFELINIYIVVRHINLRKTTDEKKKSTKKNEEQKANENGRTDM